MVVYSFTVTEHNPQRPWIVVGRENRRVELDKDVSFFEWASERWPPPRWSIDLDPPGSSLLGGMRFGG